MKWIKKGLIVKPDGSEYADVRTYIPTPYLFEDKIRIYYASLDKHLIGRIYYVDLDRDNPKNIIKFSDLVMDIGKAGCFDENGVTPSQVFKLDKNMIMLYTGWMKTTKSPQILFSSTAVSEDSGETFVRNSNVPILDRTDKEYITRSVPIQCEDKLYYTASISDFVSENGSKMSPRCTIKSVFEGKVTYLKLRKNELRLGRPFVIKEDNNFKMWYSIKGYDTPYKLGYAESKDGLNWFRKDKKVGIEASEDGWDSEMICFASILDVDDKKYMFYNGNNYGESGVGYAELQQ